MEPSRGHCTIVSGNGETDRNERKYKEVELRKHEDKSAIKMVDILTKDDKELKMCTMCL